MSSACPSQYSISVSHGLSSNVDSLFVGLPERVALPVRIAQWPAHCHAPWKLWLVSSMFFGNVAPMRVVGSGDLGLAHCGWLFKVVGLGPVCWS